MTDDPNREWAELEGWNPRGESFIEQEGSGKIYGYAPKVGEWRLPDWTEPNRFFAEVVPRMAGLELFPCCFIQTNGMWNFCFGPIKSIEASGLAIENGIGIAGLKAAIQARKEIGK